MCSVIYKSDKGMTTSKSEKNESTSTGLEMYLRTQTAGVKQGALNFGQPERY